ncbi:MAG: hypothetical protein EAY75_07100 [Bacteroidetes bacterium]|nr:MAG: hypothetical protein EAY75_07100 [Bacteroidota bacterium]
MIGIADQRGFKNTLWVALLLFAAVVHAQVPHVGGKLSIRANSMQVSIYNQAGVPAMEAFIVKANLAGLGLHQWVQQKRYDSLLAGGWTVLENANGVFTVTKPLAASEKASSEADRIVFSALPSQNNWQTMGGNRIAYGANYFVNQLPYAVGSDGVVAFFLRGYKNAKAVQLAGSFTNWQQQAFQMTRAANGWIAKVKLPPGPHYYKYLINDRWITDPDNGLDVPDGEGNVNSVFYVPNATFKLKGFDTAKSVYLAASFNIYAASQLPLQRQGNHWQTSLYVAEGTYQYYFWVDGAKVTTNADGQMQNMQASFGKPHRFVLNGFSRAKNVVLSGNFNDWNAAQLRMQKTAKGWEINYVLGPGNYQYKFIVDGQWIVDPQGGPPVGDGMGNQNSFLVIGHNYTFTLAGYPSAKSVMVAGDFNDWNPNISPMKKVDGKWIGQVFLARGKHRYKFIVDGKWILDPANKLWEENEHQSGNSIIWKE